MLEQILNKLADRIPEQKPPNKLCDLPHLYFTVSPEELGPFLYALNDYLPSVASNFASEQQKIIWVDWHFGYDPSRAATISTQLTSYNWWLSLSQDNAAAQNLPLELNFLPSNPCPPFYYLLTCFSEQTDRSI
ncbi:hypothetical protein O181_044250 [Austropuccinia psidii MF-1]|uniref:Uncharacterized protein n=1 Tax=Austropuccinia psidii MF-1 TaxID=1389203 RepID=A0A9Q3HJZ8_9BASI|nr:hypothetical protein [Austropuccinia psidii MF-1]